MSKQIDNINLTTFNGRGFNVATIGEMMNKHTGQQLDMLIAKGVNWNDYPAFFKRGTYVQRQTALRMLTTEELANISEQHQPKEAVLRSEVVKLDMTAFTKVINKLDVVFNNAVPVVES